MLLRRVFHATTPTLILGAALICPAVGSAQRQEGGSSTGGGMNGSVSGSNRPTGFDEKDSLKDFHLAMAVQASGPQITKFEALVKDTEAAEGALQPLLQQTTAVEEVTKRSAVLGQSLEKVRSDNKEFIEGFSAAQKSGLKELLKRLVKADSDVAQEQSRFDQAVQIAKTGPEVMARAQSLDKALADFSNQQLTLGT